MFAIFFPHSIRPPGCLVAQCPKFGICSVGVFRAALELRRFAQRRGFQSLGMGGVLCKGRERSRVGPLGIRSTCHAQWVMTFRSVRTFILVRFGLSFARLRIIVTVEYVAKRLGYSRSIVLVDRLSSSRICQHFLLWSLACFAITRSPLLSLLTSNPYLRPSNT